MGLIRIPALEAAKFHRSLPHPGPFKLLAVGLFKMGHLKPDNQKTRKADISAAMYARSSATMCSSSPSQTHCKRVKIPSISDCLLQAHR